MSANDLDQIILAAMNHHDDEYGPSTFQGLATAATDAVREAGYRRVVVDDAMVERAANAYRHVAHPLLVDNHAMHAALTAALGTDR